MLVAKLNRSKVIKKSGDKRKKTPNIWKGLDENKRKGGR